MDKVILRPKEVSAALVHPGIRTKTGEAVVLLLLFSLVTLLYAVSYPPLNRMGDRHQDKR